jgi:hypothetical protein
MPPAGTAAADPDRHPGGEATPARGRGDPCGGPPRHHARRGTSTEKRRARSAGARQVGRWIRSPPRSSRSRASLGSASGWRRVRILRRASRPAHEPRLHGPLRDLQDPAPPPPPSGLPRARGRSPPGSGRRSRRAPAAAARPARPPRGRPRRPGRDPATCSGISTRPRSFFGPPGPVQDVVGGQAVQPGRERVVRPVLRQRPVDLEEDFAHHVLDVLPAGCRSARPRPPRGSWYRETRSPKASASPVRARWTSRLSWAWSSIDLPDAGVGTPPGRPRFPRSIRARLRVPRAVGYLQGLLPARGLP